MPRRLSRTLYFCYADPAGFSGQKAATEMMIAGLARRGWDCRRLPQPVRQRGEADGLRELLRYALSLSLAWARSCQLLWARGAWLHVNLGQTRAAFLRDAVPLGCGVIGLGRESVAVSLHSSLFMQWPAASPDLRLFRWLLGRAGCVTVLGEGQRDRLVAHKIEARRLRIMTNTCDLAPLPAEALRMKFSRPVEQAVRLLYLSALIDTKGFPEYLEALGQMGSQPGPPIEAVICGQVAVSEFAQRFSTRLAAEDWIEERVRRINSGGRVRVRWVRGAIGPAKQALFQEADIFVFPTRYAVEAQPLVLLEAMASACAIVTTRAGEIATILDDQSAIFLEGGRVDSLALALNRLSADLPECRRLATEARSRFVANFQLDRQIDRWEEIIGGAQK